VLVLAHGSSDDGLCWTNFAKELEAAYDIIMYDARGHGLSDPPSQTDPPDAMVEDLAALIGELKLVKPILMGHSMGSSSVAAFAARYPDVPRAVVLEDPGLGVRPPGAAPAGGAAPGDPGSRRAATLARNNLSEAELVAQCMKTSPKWGAAECEIWAPSKRRHHPNTALRRPGATPMSENLGKITAPALILKADAPPALRQDNDKVAALLPKGKLVHIDGAGHNVRRENKAMALQVLREFLGHL
jgi:pimeloyl-ACP methyl ester carboxylesterase